jgi:hypothetical protein
MGSRISSVSADPRGGAGDGIRGIAIALERQDSRGTDEEPQRRDFSTRHWTAGFSPCQTRRASVILLNRLVSCPS